MNGSANVIKRYTRLDMNIQEIFLKNSEDNSQIIKVTTGFGIYGETFRYIDLINLEEVSLNEIEISQSDKYFYKGCEIGFEYERDFGWSAVILYNWDLDIKNREIYEGTVNRSMREALILAKKLIDDATLNDESKTDRDKLIELMQLPSDIRTMSKKEQNKFLIQSIKKVNERLEKIQGYLHYELSGRQKETKNNAIKNINNEEFLEAYYEIVDFVDDYGDRHNGKIYNMEKVEIFKIIRMLYENIENKSLK